MKIILVQSFQSFLCGEKMMTKDYSITFYSKDRNLFIAEEVKQIAEFKNRGVLYFDDIDQFFVNRNPMIRHLILDLTSSDIDERSCCLLKLMLKEGFISNVIIICPKDRFYGKEFYHIEYSKNFTCEISHLLDKIFESEDMKDKKLIGAWRSEISNQLCLWGFSPKCNGFSMLIDIIIYYVSKRCVVKKLSKEGYLAIAQKYCVTPACVELSVRKAIRIAMASKERFPIPGATTNKGFIIYAISQLYDSLCQKKNAIVG